eukprot:768500-Hanusia_phi.AAC.8
MTRGREVTMRERSVRKGSRCVEGSDAGRGAEGSWAEGGCKTTLRMTLSGGGAKKRHEIVHRSASMGGRKFGGGC